MTEVLALTDLSLYLSPIERAPSYPFHCAEPYSWSTADLCYHTHSTQNTLYCMYSSLPNLTTAFT